jgi:hypothetical protein
LIVSLNGDVSPLEIPRSRPAPVALRIAGQIRTADNSPLPRVRRIGITLGGRGVVFTRGLPVCPRARIRTASSRQALDRCGPALVGRGRLDAVIRVPRQDPFRVEGRILAFNGRTGSGRPAVWVHAFAGSPPVSIVLPFIVRRSAADVYRTSLTMILPRSIGPWARLAGFEITYFRRYRYRGRLRSYLSASCPVPSGFTAGFLAFARATYGFADGRQLRVESVRSCRVR